MMNREVLELLKTLKQLNARLYMEKGKLKLDIQKGVLTAELREQITCYRDEIISFLNSKEEKYEEIANVPENAYYPLSSAQRRLWILSQFKEGNIAYNMPGTYEFKGHLNREALTHAFKSLVVRHEILRTVFKEDETDEIKQFINPPEDSNFTINYQDIRQEQDKQEKARQTVQEAIVKPFDLEQGPLLKAQLLHLEEDTYLFTYVMHHIISDGWSMELLIRELLTLYNAYNQGYENPLKTLRIQYKDYAAWQQQQLSGAHSEKHQQYWLDRFSGEIPVLEMPTDRLRPAVKTYNGAIVSSVISKTLTDKLKEIVQQEEATLFMGLVAVVKTLLYKYTGQEDIIAGSPIAGRDHSDLEDQIGFYINTLALRTQFSGADSYRKLLNNIKQVTLGAYEHQIYPFDELIDTLHLERDTSRSALFDIMVALQNTDIGSAKSEQRLGDIVVKAYEGGEQLTSDFDLSFDFTETGEELHTIIEYNSDLFNKNTIEQLSGHIKQILEAIVRNPDKSINKLDYLSETERHRLLETFNDTASDYPKDKTVTDLFEEQAEKFPDNAALVFEENIITYSELNAQSNQFAAYLRSSYDIKPDHFIGIKLDRGEWMIITMLGIIKSGGAYLPIDPDYPEERISYILEDSQCKILIDEEELSKFREKQQEYTQDNPISVTKPHDLIYALYTSGSTGKPKGVMISHRNLSSRLLGEAALLELNSDTKSCLIGNYVFDVTLLEIFLPLLIGGAVIIPTEENTSNLEELLDIIKNQGVTILQGTPSYYTHLSELLDESYTDGLQLNTICLGGESLNNTLVKELRRKLPGVRINNQYGPTEATMDAIVLKDIKTFSDDIIGKPMPNTRIYIVDAHGALPPIGVPGEICIAGDGVARGYLNNPELTNKSFVMAKFKPGERIYKTGDIGKWLPDGNIIFLGRKDSQVKIRGYRIELGEIQNVLQNHHTVEEAAVLVKKNTKGEKNLVAYITAKEVLNSTIIRTWLKELLPNYMVPSQFVQLEKMPLTANDKIDKKALPDPEALGMSSGIVYEAPGNEIEEKLVAIWEDILGKDKIGVKDNFFELGGHSIKAIKVISEVQKIFNVKIDIAKLFHEPNIAELAIEVANQSWFNKSVDEDKIVDKTMI